MGILFYWISEFSCNCQIQIVIFVVVTALKFSFIQTLSFRAWMLKLAQTCSGLNYVLTDFSSALHDGYQHHQRWHLRSNPTGYTSHASGPYPRWGDSNTGSIFTALLNSCSDVITVSGSRSPMPGPAALISDPTLLVFPLPAEAVDLMLLNETKEGDLSFFSAKVVSCTLTSCLTSHSHWWFFYAYCTVSWGRNWNGASGGISSLQ